MSQEEASAIVGVAHARGVPVTAHAMDSTDLKRALDAGVDDIAHMVWDELTDELIAKIKQTIRVNASPRHVPAKIVAVPDVPYTLNMKKVELAVKKTIEGKAVLNKDALRNPEVLDFYAGIKALKED